MRRRISNLLKGQQGFGLVETLVAMAILGVIGVGFIQALGTTSEGTDIHEERVTASSLAQSQVEYIKSLGYDATASNPDPGVDYPVGVSLPLNYSMTVDTTEEQTGKQEVTVKVYHLEDFVLDMTTLKVDW